MGVFFSALFLLVVNVLQGRISDLECQLTAERTRRISDAEEWKQFQADLLMTVRVANDFQVRIVAPSFSLPLLSIYCSN
jgi:hypothetical protein